MTKLTDEQQDLLTRIKEARDVYDAEVAYWEADMKRRRSELKQPIRELVLKAKDAGIPMRQIHLTGLGMNQVGQMTAFLAPYSPTEQLERALSEVREKSPVEIAPSHKPFTRSVVEISKDKFRYNRGTDESYEFFFNPHMGWFEMTPEGWTEEIEDELYAMKPEWAKARDRAGMGD